MLHGFSPGIVSQGASAYLLEQSLLFDGTAYFDRTPSTAGNRKTWTFSCWLKRGELGVSDSVFSAGDGGSNYSRINFQADNTLIIVAYTGASAVYNYQTSAVFRDISAWYHIVVQQDVAAGAVALWVNGVSVALNELTQKSINYDGYINSTFAHSVGRLSTIAAIYSGLMALPILVDGAALDPTSFGEEDDGYWNPIEFTGTTIPLYYGPDTTSGETFTQSSAFSGRTATNAFDDNIATRWNSSGSTSGSEWIQIQYATARTISYMNLTGGDAGRGPKVFTVEGSNTGSFAGEEVLLLSKTGETGWGTTETRGYAFSTTGSYSYYRLTVDETVTQPEYREIWEVELLEAIPSTEGFGTNGFQLGFEDTTFFGKNVSGTDDQAALSSATIGTSNWLDIPAAFTAGSGTLSRTSTAHSARSSNVLTGDFSITMNLTAGMAGFRCGVYAAAEDGTWKFADADAMGDATAMTDSYFLNMGAGNFQKGSATFGSTTQAAGTCTVVRVGSTITITAVNGTKSYAFTSAYTGPMRFMVGGGGVAITLTTLSWTADGQAGNSYFDTNFTASDQLEDSPTSSVDDGIGNYITLVPNPVQTGLVLSEGNTHLTSSGSGIGDGGIKGNIFVSSGVWHWEVTAVNTATNAWTAGITTVASGTGAGADEVDAVGDYAFVINGGQYWFDVNGTSGYPSRQSISSPNGRVFGFIYDYDAGTLNVYNAGLSGGVATLTSIPTTSEMTVVLRSSNAAHEFDCNFGQRPFVDGNLNNANAIATQNLPDTHPLYTGTAAQYRAGATIQSITLNANSGGNTNYTFRSQIPSSAIATQNFTKVRIKMEASTAGDIDIDAIYIDAKATSGNAWDYQGTQVALTLNGDGAFNIPTGGSLWSDWVELSDNGADGLVVGFDIGASNGDLRYTASGSGYSWHIKASTDAASVTAPAGLSTTASYCALVTAIEVQ